MTADTQNQKYTSTPLAIMISIIVNFLVNKSGTQCECLPDLYTPALLYNFPKYGLLAMFDGSYCYFLNESASPVDEPAEFCRRSLAAARGESPWMVGTLSGLGAGSSSGPGGATWMLASDGDRFSSLLGTLARGDALGGAGIRSWTKPARGVTTGIEGSSARGVSP